MIIDLDPLGTEAGLAVQAHHGTFDGSADLERAVVLTGQARQRTLGPPGRWRRSHSHALVKAR